MQLSIKAQVLERWQKMLTVMCSCNATILENVPVSLTACCVSLPQQPWDRVSTPTQSLQRMSMSTPPEKGLDSQPFGIVVSHIKSYDHNQFWKSFISWTNSLWLTLLVFADSSRWDPLCKHRRLIPRHEEASNRVCVSSDLQPQRNLSPLSSVPCRLDEWCRRAIQTPQLDSSCRNSLFG